MRKKDVWKLIPIIMMCLAGCGKASEPEVTDRTVTVTAEPVQIGTMQMESSFIGSVSADNRVNISTSVSGTVESIPVSIGDYVNTGDVLCQLEDTSARLNLENANNSQSLSNELDLARQYYSSMKILYDTGDISKLELDQAYQSVLSAQRAVESARVASDTAEYQLGLYTITAPISGIVEQIYAVENSALTQGSIAFVVSDPEIKTVTFYVTEQIKEVLTYDQPIRLDYRDKQYRGAIREIGIGIDETGLFKIEAFLEDAEMLPVGITAELITVSHIAKDMCQISSDALYFDDGNPYVYMVQDNKAARVDVEIALYGMETTAVSEGISPGQQLITSWSADLKDGIEIRMEEVADHEAD